MTDPHFKWAKYRDRKQAEKSVNYQPKESNVRYSIGKVGEDWIVMKNGEPDKRFIPFRDDTTFRAVAEVLEELERIDRVKETLPQPMANKSEGVKKMIESLFPTTAKMLKEAKCPLCHQPVRPEEFRDSKSRKEYGISGMCMECQDEVFGK